MCFTLPVFAAYLGKAFSEAFRFEVGRPDGVVYLSNFYEHAATYFLQYIAALQGWIFEVHYWQNDAVSFIIKTWFTEKKIFS